MFLNRILLITTLIYGEVLAANCVTVMDSRAHWYTLGIPIEKPITYHRYPLKEQWLGKKVTVRITNPDSAEAWTLSSNGKRVRYYVGSEEKPLIVWERESSARTGHIIYQGDDDRLIILLDEKDSIDYFDMGYQGIPYSYHHKKGTSIHSWMPRLGDMIILRDDSGENNRFAISEADAAEKLKKLRQDYPEVGI